MRMSNLRRILTLSKIPNMECRSGRVDCFIENIFRTRSFPNWELCLPGPYPCTVILKLEAPGIYKDSVLMVFNDTNSGFYSCIGSWSVNYVNAVCVSCKYLALRFLNWPSWFDNKTKISGLGLTLAWLYDTETEIRDDDVKPRVFLHLINKSSMSETSTIDGDQLVRYENGNGSSDDASWESLECMYLQGSMLINN